jgi:hypothetical protein
MITKGKYHSNGDTFCLLLPGLRSHTEQTKACVVSFPVDRGRLVSVRTLRADHHGSTDWPQIAKKWLVFCPAAAQVALSLSGPLTGTRLPSGRAILVGPEVSPMAAA